MKNWKQTETKRYKITNYIYIIEVNQLEDKDQFGEIDRFDHECRIYIKATLSNADKLSALEHELTHLIQLEKEEEYERKYDEAKMQKRDEVIAVFMEKIKKIIVRKYPPFILGAVELLYSK